MRVHRTDMEGIGILRISGVVVREDALTLLRFLGIAPGGRSGCFILDFRGVEHVDYHVFESLDNWFSGDPNVVLSGLSDYLLNIYAFISKSNAVTIFSDWRKALHYLMVERGKLGAPVAAGLAGQM